jgi:hypothetical protein
LSCRALRGIPRIVRDGVPLHFVLPRHASAEGPLACARGDISRSVIPRHESAEGPLVCAQGDISRSVFPRRPSAEGPLTCARGDMKGARGDIKGNHSEHPISSFRTSYSCHFERSEKSPHPVMPLPPVLPSNSEASASHSVVPNDSEASLILAREEEGSRLRPRDDKKGLGATKQGSKRQREGLHKNIFEQSFPTLDYFIPNV